MAWMIPTYVALAVAGLGVLGLLAFRVLGEVRALARAMAAAGRRVGDALADLESATSGLGQHVGEGEVAPARGRAGATPPAPGVPSSLTPG